MSALLLASTLAATACNRGTQAGSSGGSSGNGGVTVSGGSTSGGGSGSGGSSAQGGTVGTGGSSKPGGAAGSGGGASGGAAGGTGGAGPITTLGGSKPIGTLTPTEATQLCADTFAYFGQAIGKPTLCKWTGLTYAVSSSAPSDARLQDNCKSQENACLAAGSATPSCRAWPASCTATVAQYSACIVDKVAALNDGVGALAACASIKLSDLEAVWAFTTADPPASCASLTDRCPELDVPTPRPGSNGVGGASGGNTGTTATGGAGGTTGATGGAIGTGGSVRTGGTTGATGGAIGTGGTGGATAVSTLPGDVAKAAGTPFVAAHAMTRALFAAYTGPLFKALRDSDKQEKDIGIVASTGLVDLAALNAFCAGTTCKVTTLYDQSGNGNDMWRGDTAANSPMDNGEAPRLCDLMAIDYWQLSDGTKIPVVVETGPMWKDKAQCLRNRDKTKNMPTGAQPQTTYAIFHAKYLNNNCCFNYGNTGKRVHYTGPGTLSALNFSKIEFWSKGKGTGPWVMVDWEQGVYAGNLAKCGSGVPATAECTTTGENASNPSVTFDIVTTLFKHDGVNHWAAKHGNAKAGPLAVSIDLPTLPKGGYSPLKQEGGLGLGEGGAGDPNGTGGFSEGAVMAGETSDNTDSAIQQSIVSVYGR